MGKSINIRVGYDLKHFSTESQKLSRALKRQGDKMKDIGMALSTRLTLPILALGGASVKAAADIESLKTSLGTALGGTQEMTDAAFGALQRFATQTPLSLEEVTNSFIKLKNMGLDPTESALESYGNTASAMGKTLNDMVEAVADAAVGEFERLKEFGIKAKSEGDRVKFIFKGVTTEVGKNAKEIEAYLKGIGDTEFAGGMEKQSKTLNGVISTLKDNFSLAAASMGEVLMPALKKIASWFGKIAIGIQQLNPVARKAILVALGLAAAIGPLIALVGALSVAAAALNVSMLPLTAIILGIIAVIAGLAAAYIYIKANTEAFKEAFLNIFKRLKNGLVELIKLILKPYKLLFDLLGINLGEKWEKGLDSLKDKVEESKHKFGSFSDALKDSSRQIKSSLSDLVGGTSTATKQVSASIDKSSKKISKSVDAIKLKVGELASRRKVEIPVELKVDVKQVDIAFKKTVSAEYERIKSYFENINKLIEDSVTNIAETMAVGLGNALATGDWSNFGNNVLMAVADFVGQLGRLTLAYGIAALGLQKAIAAGPLGAPIAIAAGIALIAAASAMKAHFSKGMSSGSSYNTSTFSGGSFGSSSGINKVNQQRIVLSGRDMIITTQREGSYNR